ncbi:MAG: hypothetical protein COT15_04685 [Candidatus Diapherotrites archaeon CG08_land_8_20_14_0_20_34_12]|nr:MAG: hypothetical protein COT15_04685 [Candidatus Diapherotrites archaeon CG08_land_8_20_14_0_20_34_12]
MANKVFSEEQVNRSMGVVIDRYILGGKSHGEPTFDAAYDYLLDFAESRGIEIGGSPTALLLRLSKSGYITNRAQHSSLHEVEAYMQLEVRLKPIGHLVGKDFYTQLERRLKNAPLSEKKAILGSLSGLDFNRIDELLSLRSKLKYRIDVEKRKKGQPVDLREVAKVSGSHNLSDLTEFVQAIDVALDSHLADVALKAREGVRKLKQQWIGKTTPERIELERTFRELNEGRIEMSQREVDILFDTYLRMIKDPLARNAASMPYSVSQLIERVNHKLGSMPQARRIKIARKVPRKLRLPRRTFRK